VESNFKITWTIFAFDRPSLINGVGAGVGGCYSHTDELKVMKY
jgi:hypothetical protein